MARFGRIIALALCLSLCVLPDTTNAQLKLNFYADTCPDVESIVRKVVEDKVKQTFVTIPATLRLFFHDCAVNGCDASIMIQSTATNKAEKDHPDNLSLAGDGFDTVIKAKQAVNKNPKCRNKVSCADILAMATRDVIALAGGPSYEVELGRRDGLTSTAASVNLPKHTDDLDQLTAIYAKMGLNQTDLIALSAAHTVGFAHCTKVLDRIYNQVDPTINKDYLKDLRAACPRNVDPRIAINMDPVTPRKFDNIYYVNLQNGKGLFKSDQVLFTDGRSRPLVDAWARDEEAFNKAFIESMTKLGRAGVLTGNRGDIRHDCGAFN